ncbi:MAG: alpha/beta hydrolase [Candidatus Saccharimonadales bacterium]
MTKASDQAEDFIVPLNMNGLEGRMLRMPAKKKNQPEILFIYGQHSSLERWWGLVAEMNKLGAVTMPDLPGMGGMTPLYKIGQTPTIDNMADYLAAFIKLKFKNKKVTIAAMSLGFVIATRTLQKYPELTKKVNMLISVVGFAHGSDFIFSRRRRALYKTFSWVFARKWPSRLFRYTALQPAVLRLIYHRSHNAKEKFIQMAGDEFNRTMSVEIDLWHRNDIRTQFRHYLEMMGLDNTKKRVDLPVYHVTAKKDRYFNGVKVEENMRRIFNDFEVFYSVAPNHAPTIIASAEEAAPFIPPGLRRKIKSMK